MKNNQKTITQHAGKYLCRYWSTLSDGTKCRKNFYANGLQEAECRLRVNAANYNNTIEEEAQYGE